MKLPVGVRSPFDLGQSLAFLRRFEACRDDYVIDERGVTAAISVATAAHLLGADDDLTGFYAAAEGIGPFSAAAILLRGLGRMDDVPLEGRTFETPARTAYGAAWDPRAIRARYGAHVGYWSFYLKTGEARGAYAVAHACSA